MRTRPRTHTHTHTYIYIYIYRERERERERERPQPLLIRQRNVILLWLELKTGKLDYNDVTEFRLILDPI